MDDPLAADRQFFAALLAGSAGDLDRILTDDFVIIDVMSGAEATKPAFLAVVGSGDLRFEAIEPAENRVRLYGQTAVITGRTRMRGSYAGAPFAARSRYTHVFVEQAGRWRLASAQGTPIAGE
jgi:ketosteroid isomerase-like protein